MNYVATLVTFPICEEGEQLYGTRSFFCNTIDPEELYSAVENNLLHVPVKPETMVRVTIGDVKTWVQAYQVGQIADRLHNVAKFYKEIWVALD